MAQVTKTRLVDDLDGGNADESVNFTVDNHRYQMDLSETNAARLREVLAPFIAAARRAGGSTTTRTRRSTIAARPAGAGADTAAIREWASATPLSPRAFSERRNCVQNAPSSESPTANPRTSRHPSARTPVAITTAWETRRWFTRALQCR